MTKIMTGAVKAADLIVREYEPTSLEFPFDQLDSFLTPNELFYVRSHFKAPDVPLDRYQLTIGGAVAKPFSVTYSELTAMPSLTLPATLECAGNSRIFMIPQVKGVQWQLGAVGTAEWTGVPLSTLLERAGMADHACDILFQGADKGKPKEEPIPPEEIHYARSIPVSKAGDVLIAYHMNGVEITRDHGFPVRAIVRGHYGMASVKWLTQITVLQESFNGYWQTSDYGWWDELAGNAVRRPLDSMLLKSEIARPRMREAVSAGSRYEIYGAAWSGGAMITRVEVTTDRGETWQEAILLDDAEPFVWCRWKLPWNVPTDPCNCTLMSRAQDASGNVQPAHHNQQYGSYVVHHTLPIEVSVR